MFKFGTMVKSQSGCRDSSAAVRPPITSRMSLLKVVGLGDGEEMPIFQSERGGLHYEDLGGSRPILLIHGFTNYGLARAPQLAPLVRGISGDYAGSRRLGAATSLCAVADLAADMVVDASERAPTPQIPHCLAGFRGTAHGQHSAKLHAGACAGNRPCNSAV